MNRILTITLLICLSLSVAANESCSMTAENDTAAQILGIPKKTKGTIIQLGAAFPVAGNAKPDKGIGARFVSGYYRRFMTYELLFEYNRMLEYNLIGLGFRLGGLLPIQLSQHVLLAPNIKFEIGADLTVGEASPDYPSSFFFGGVCGVEALFRLGRTKDYMTIGVDYEHRGFLSHFNKSIKPLDNMGYVNAHIGFIF